MSIRLDVQLDYGSESTRYVASATLDGEGTSPRVRGKRRGHPSQAASLGYIPACAGETFRFPR